MKIPRIDIMVLAIALSCFLTFIGCKDESSPKKVSSDMAALQKIVDLDVAAKSGRWEIFDSPEQSGLQVGPTDSTILMVELITEDKTPFSKLLPGDEWIYVPEAERPWLDQNFRSLFKHKTGRSIDLSSESKCKPYNGKLKKPGKNVRGFTCISEKKQLIYLVLASDMG